MCVNHSWATLLCQVECLCVCVCVGLWVGVVTGGGVDVCQLQLSGSVVSGRMCVDMRVCVVVG